jgi:hypothetical protein
MNYRTILAACVLAVASIAGIMAAGGDLAVPVTRLDVTASDFQLYGCSVQGCWGWLVQREASNQ